MHCQPPRPTSLPYTTLFRSRAEHGRGDAEHEDRDREDPADRDLTGVEVRHERDLEHAEGVDLADAQVDGQSRRRDQPPVEDPVQDRKSTRLNSSHVSISYAV